MTEPITFAQLDTILSQLGLRKTIVRDSHVVYKHEPTDTALYFPPYRPKDLVPAGSMLGTRKVLIDRGVVEAEQLDELLHATVAKSIA
jgi:hypothetical protein